MSDNDIPSIFDEEGNTHPQTPADFVPRTVEELGALEPSGEETSSRIARLVTDYRIYQSQKKIAEANLDGLKGDLKPLLTNLADGWADERGFAKIVTPKTPIYHFVSDDNAGALYDLATNWAASDVPSVKQAGITTLALIETKTRNPYVLVK